MTNKTVVFDLDDTLIPEICYLRSAYKYIANKLDHENKYLYHHMMQWYYSGLNVFLILSEKYIIDKSTLLKLYREHTPNLKLSEGALQLLVYLKNQNCHLGMITDGRSVTQRNKIKAVGIEDYFDDIIISEEFGSDKFDASNFEYFHKNSSHQYYYIGDNTSKDFYNPNRLNWISICLVDTGHNIHKQDFNVEEMYLPQFKVNTLQEVINIINL